MKRILTAAAMIPVVVYVALWAPLWAFLAVITVVAFLCYHEYDSIASNYGFGVPGPLGYLAGLAIFLWQGDAWLVMTAVALIALAAAMRSDNMAKSLPLSALLLMGTVYIFGTWKCGIELRRINPQWLMYGLLVNWTGDVGAYYIGRAFGSKKLATRVSPNKTWEGSLASVAASVVFAGAYLMHFIPGVAPVEAIVLTAFANIAGQFGDLAESAIKRGAGVKDSGAILPGHGGFLDRVDSTLFALPVIYAYLKLAS
jgi:phosphatidate cytidylyltransferase